MNLFEDRYKNKVLEIPSTKTFIRNFIKLYSLVRSFETIFVRLTLKHYYVFEERKLAS